MFRLDPNYHQQTRGGCLEIRFWTDRQTDRPIFYEDCGNKKRKKKHSYILIRQNNSIRQLVTQL